MALSLSLSPALFFAPFLLHSQFTANNQAMNIQFQLKSAFLYSIISFTYKETFAGRKRGGLVLINNIEIDVKVKCIEESKTQAKLAEELSTTRSYVSRLIKTPEKIINKTFVATMEALGYDIELSYVKREG